MFLHKRATQHEQVDQWHLSMMSWDREHNFNSRWIFPNENILHDSFEGMWSYRYDDSLGRGQTIYVMESDWPLRDVSTFGHEIDALLLTLCSPSPNTPTLPLGRFFLPRNGARLRGKQSTQTRITAFSSVPTLLARMLVLQQTQTLPLFAADSTAAILYLRGLSRASCSLQMMLLVRGLAPTRES